MTNIYFFPSYQSTFIFQSERNKWNLQCSTMQWFLIMPGACSSNCCAIIFDLVDLHKLLFKKLKLTCIFFNLKNINGTCNTTNFSEYLGMLSPWFPKSWKSLDVQRKFKNIFKIFVKIFENLGSINVKCPQRYS